MQPLMGPYVYGVNRRLENFLLLSDLLFAWGRCTRSRYKRIEIRVVWAVYLILWCTQRWYIQAWSRLRSATGIQMVIFIELVQYAKKNCRKSRKILVERLHDIPRFLASLPRTRNMNNNIQNMQHFLTFLASRNLNRTTLELFFSLNQWFSIWPLRRRDYMMLHNKYHGSRLCGFREEDFFCFPYIMLYKTCDTWGGTIFDPRGIIWTNLVEVCLVLLTTKYQGSQVCGFRQEDVFFKFSLYKPM